jgi:hypothetical protein
MIDDDGWKHALQTHTNFNIFHNAGQQ